MLNGTDISHHQAPLGKGQFQTAAGARRYDEFDFVYIRSHYGDRPDIHAKTHALACEEAKVPYGFYVFWRPSMTAFPEVPPAPLKVAVDIESNDRYDGPLKPEYAEDLDAFMMRAHERLKYLPIVYTSAADWTKLGNPLWLLSHTLWVAHWTSKPEPATPLDMPWAIWQHSNSLGVLDLNRAPSFAGLLAPPDKRPSLEERELAERYIELATHQVGTRPNEIVDWAYALARETIARRG